jgi:hypothetical protein
MWCEPLAFALNYFEKAHNTRWTENPIAGALKHGLPAGRGKAEEKVCQ